jgi:tetratricopeptide (TPR) repeat protein
MAPLDWLADLLAGGKRRRLRRALARAEAAFAPATLEGAALDRAAAAYRGALRLALRVKPPRAVELFRAWDGRLPADRYAAAFRPADAPWLGRLGRGDDANVLTVVVDLADRLGLEAVRRSAAERLALLLGRAGDANRLVVHLLRCRQLRLLAADTLTRAVGDHLTRSPLERDAALGSSFFATLPEALLPPLFEVRHFLGRGTDAVGLADTPARQQQALACCLRSPRVEDVRAGLGLARRLGDAGAARRLQERAGDLLLDAGRYAESLNCYRKADRPDRASECHERLGQFWEALAACPSGQPDRLARLAGLCQPDVDALVERQEFVEAARQAQALVGHLSRAAEGTPEAAASRDEAAGLRAGVLAAGRQHFSHLAHQAAEPRGVHETWSRFEEEAGEPARVAQRAEDAGDRYRAHRLFRQAGLFGDAVRVLEPKATPEALAGRAEARADGGDLAGAARLYEQAGKLDQAARLFQQAGEFATAARCLVRHLGDEAVESPQLAECLRRTGDFAGLVRVCVRAVEQKGRATRAVEELRRLLDAGDVPLPDDLAASARAALEDLGARGRRSFEERAQAWVARARADRLRDQRVGVPDGAVARKRLEVAASRIGHFRLEGLRPAKKGEPKVVVTFTIDASCLLEVTARDQQTGLSSSIELTDTTLLSPTERDALARRFDEQQEREGQRQQLRELLEDLTRQVADAAGGDSAALVREWRSRLAAHRPPAVPPDAATQQTLFELFNKANELESELLLAEVPLRDLADKAREYLERTGRPNAGAPAAPAVAAALAEGQHLAAELTKHLGRRRPLRARLAAWNGVLVKLATAETDPLHRFLACHEAGDHARALEALAELPAPLDHLPHVIKQLDCLARVGDAAGYRRVLSAHAGPLGACPIDPARPEAFLARARPALVRVQVAREDGQTVLGSGFLLADRMVATNRRWLAREPEGQRAPIDVARVEVLVESGRQRVERILLARAPQCDVALLRLAGSAEAVPFRLGPAGLVRIGDPVWAAAPAADPAEALVAGVVQRFESFPEWQVRLFRVGLRVPAWYTGGPLFNDLGEVVGVLTLKERAGGSVAAEACFAQTADSLEPLLTVAGLGRWPVSAGPEAIPAPAGFGPVEQ